MILGMSLWRKLRSLSTIKDQIDLTKLFPNNQKDVDDTFPHKLSNHESLENQLSESNKSLSEKDLSIIELRKTTSRIKTSTEPESIITNPNDINLC